MMRCSSMVEHSAVNRTVAGSNPAAAAMLLLFVLLSGCIFVYDSDGSYDTHYTYGLDGSWDCTDYGSMDEWEFWINPSFYDVSYILVEVIDLIDGNNLHVSFLDYDVHYGYYYHREDFSLPGCGTAVDVEFTVYDYEGYWEKYIIYW
jgi:hypothetical protein